jgi:chromosome segregation ATPase
MNTQLNGTNYTADIESEITRIRVFIEEELGEKRELIRQKDRQLAELKNIAGKKDHVIGSLEAKLKELEGETDGNRQLINKLLGDLSKLQNDIEWYKRTYEKRSFLGVIKEKILKKIR